MTITTTRTALIATVFGAAVALSACSSNQVAENTGSTVGFVAKTAVKGTVGAGKLVAKGVRKATSDE